MELMTLWLIGLGIAAILRLVIIKLCTHDFYNNRIGNKHREYDEFFNIYSIKNKKILIIIHILVIASIVIEGGINSVALIDIVTTMNSSGWNYAIAIIACPAFVGVVLYLFLGLYHFKKVLSQVVFLITFTVSVLFWRILI